MPFRLSRFAVVGAAGLTLVSGAGATTHVSGHLDSQRLTGVGIPSGQLYNVDFINNSIVNSRVDGANVSTLEEIINVVSLGSAPNSQIQTVLHITQNANGEITTQFQNFHVHCSSEGSL
jgi:hypothetical protein